MQPMTLLSSKRLAAPTWALLFAILATPGCVSDLDFNEIAPQCEDPRFDAPGRDTFCSGSYDISEPIAPPEDKRVVGADINSQVALLTTVSEIVSSNDVSLLEEVSFHLIETDDLSSLQSLDEANVTTITTNTFNTNIIAPLKTELLDDRDALIGALFQTAFIPAQGTPLPDEDQELLIAPYLIRLPLESFADKRSYFVDMASLSIGDDRLVLIAAGTAGLKPLLYTHNDTLGFWEEKLLDGASPMAFRDFSCSNLCCLDEGSVGEFEDICQTIRRTARPNATCTAGTTPYCLTYPLGRGAYSVDIDPQAKRLYVGSVGTIYIYDATLLTPENLENLSVGDAGFNDGVLQPFSDSFNIPPINQEELGVSVPQDIPLGNALITELTVYEDWLYAVLVDEDAPADNNPTQPYLFQLRLENGLPTDEYIITALPVFKTQGFVATLLPLDNDLLVYQTTDSVELLFEDPVTPENSPEFPFLSQKDTGLFVIDLIHRENPRVLFEEELGHQGESGVGGIGGEQGAQQMLLTTPEGFELRRLSVSGERF